MKYEVILLDVDNTLLDFDRCGRYALKKTCEDVGFTYSSELNDKYNAFNDILWRSLEKGEIDLATLKEKRFEKLIAHYQIDAEPKAMSEYFMGHLGETDFEVEGAFELCKKLSKKYTLATMTNGISAVQRGRFKKSRLGTMISHQFISEEIGYSKPDPRIFDHALKALGITDKSKILMVGDSLSSDMKGGYAAGIDTCFFNPNGLEASVPVTYNIKHLLELPELLANQ